MHTFGDLRERAETALLQHRFADALGDYLRLVELRPADLDARLRVGDLLTALGRVQEAAVIYTRLAQHAARAGYPLRTLVAVKLLATLEPKLQTLSSAVAQLYAKGASRVGKGVRQAPPDPTTALPMGWDRPGPDGEPLQERAAQVAAEYAEGDLFYPDMLMPIPLLSSLPQETFAEVLTAVKLVRAAPGTTVVEQASEGHSFFMVARGALQVVRRDAEGNTQQLAALHDGSIFGEMALLSPDPRSASVVATTDCDLLEFDGDALSALATDKTLIANALSTFARERLLQNTMATCGLFSALDMRQRRDLIRRFVAMEAKPGTLIIREGQAGTGLFVVLRGHVEVTKVGAGQAQRLAVLGPSETFGEMALLSGEPTSANVIALDSASLLFLERSYFLRLVHAVPEVRAYLERMSDERQLDTSISFDDGEPPPPLSVAPEIPSACSLEVEVEVLL